MHTNASAEVDLESRLPITLPSLKDVWTQLLDLSERNFLVLSTDKADYTDETMKTDGLDMGHFFKRSVPFSSGDTVSTTVTRCKEQRAKGATIRNSAPVNVNVKQDSPGLRRTRPVPRLEGIHR